jgi:hypothetical protein
VPQLNEELVVNSYAPESQSGIAMPKAVFTTGRHDKVQNFMSNMRIYDAGFSRQIAGVEGLHYTELEITAS